MAQYYWNASEQSVSDGLNDIPLITPISTFEQISIVASGFAANGVPQALYMLTSGANFWQVLYAPDGTNPLMAGDNVEIYMDWYSPTQSATDNASQRFPAMLLASGTSGTNINGVLAGTHWDHDLVVVQYSSGTYIERATAGTPRSVAARRGQRSRVSPDKTVLTRVWDCASVEDNPAASEPVDWGLSGTHTLSTSDGGVGFFNRGSGGSSKTRRYLIAIGIGTNGDAAPTAPPISSALPTLSGASFASRVPSVTLTY